MSEARTARAPGPKSRALRVLGALAVLAGSAGGCSPVPAGEAASPPAGTGSPAAAAADAEPALAYAGGDAPTDRLVAAAQAAVRAHPAEERPYLELATALMRRSRETASKPLMRLAAGAVSAARARAPADTMAMLLEAMILQESHRFRESADVARRVLAAAPSDSTAELVLGDALLELGEFDAAVGAYQAALDLRPDLRGYDRGAWARWLSGDTAGAVEMLELALDAGSPADPESSAWCYVDLGNVMWHGGEPDKALAAAARAEALVPEYVPALLLEARALGALGRRGEAIARLDGAVRRLPTAEALFALGELLRAEGRTPEAEEREADGLSLAKEDPRAVALFLARRGDDPAGALALAEAAVRDRPSHQAWAVLALARLRAGRLEEAGDAIGRARALGTPDARYALVDGLVKLAAGDRAGAAEALAEAEATNRFADDALSAELWSALEVEP